MIKPIVIISNHLRQSGFTEIIPAKVTNNSVLPNPKTNLSLITEKFPEAFCLVRFLFLFFSFLTDPSLKFSYSLSSHLPFPDLGIKTFSFAIPWFSVCCAQSLSPVWLSVTPWTVSRWAPLSMGFPTQEYWSDLSFPSLRDLPDSWIEPTHDDISDSFKAFSLLF